LREAAPPKRARVKVPVGLGIVLSKIETVTVTMSAHRLDSYRSVEQRARQRWSQALADRGESWRDAGLRLVAHEPDADQIDHIAYRFEGTMVACTKVA